MEKIKNSLVSIRAYTGSLIILGTIIICAVVEGAVPLPDRSSSSLVHKMPVETREGPVLSALALYKEGTLFNAKFLQVSGMRIHRATHYLLAFHTRGSRCFFSVSFRFALWHFLALGHTLFLFFFFFLTYTRLQPEISFYVARDPPGGRYLLIMIHLFCLSCQQRFSIGLHLGQHHTVNARAHAR